MRYEESSVGYALKWWGIVAGQGFLQVSDARMLIGGRLVEAREGSVYDNVNPANETIIGVTPDATRDDMRDAISSARQAFDQTTWSRDAAFRRVCLEQLATALANSRTELIDMVVAETGCPVSIAGPGQVDVPIAHAAHWAAAADAYDYEQELASLDLGGTIFQRMLSREPFGVVGAITPWNYPMFLNIAKLGPALASGNTVVLKPAPDTPWSATALGKIIAEQTDIPPGVVNIVTSSDHALGEILTTDPRVDMIAFTGSTATGRAIMANASQTVKKLALELGGKSAHILLDDADVAGTVPQVMFEVCMHGGQGCSLTTRLLAPRSRYDEVVEIATRAARTIPFGDPLDPANIQGPQVSALQRDRVMNYIENGVEQGGNLVVGGGRPAGFQKGYFVEPTLFVDVDPSSRIAQEEIFGPVLVVIPYADDADAIRIANGTIYGLSGAVTSASPERAMAVAKQMRSGTVGVNGGIWFGADVPFGGYGQSGLGRENGVMGFEEFLEAKTIAVKLP